MNWTAVQALVHAFAIANHAYIDSTEQEILVYEPNKIIFHPAKLIVHPCASGTAACVRCAAQRFGPTASMEQLGAHDAEAFHAETRRAATKASAAAQASSPA